jgi:hypothetical protein
MKAARPPSNDEPDHHPIMPNVRLDPNAIKSALGNPIANLIKL